MIQLFQTRNIAATFKDQCYALTREKHKRLHSPIFIYITYIRVLHREFTYLSIYLFIRSILFIQLYSVLYSVIKLPNNRLHHTSSLALQREGKRAVRIYQNNCREIKKRLSIKIQSILCVEESERERKISRNPSPIPRLSRSSCFQ